ncbi:LamG-like jellyroll fold domain-containing protein [Haloferula sp. BvORR071]|uniref:LamG-like jellyroll fold domain-containing protein n=1 Tax=Haloferula sp. BvORR071 TaxID=1396141 RepID=UPI000557D285|nr:LamG-like jellyroll fold domain-containing protein [Haloferula sp. BvORR071]
MKSKLSCVSSLGLALSSLLLVGKAAAEYYNFNTEAGSDILYQEVRYPYWAQSTYNARYYNNVQDESGHSVFFYSGTTYDSAVATGSSTPRNNGYIWSFWPVSNPVSAGDAVVPGWWNPPFYDVPSVGEGASGKIETTTGLANMNTNVWYASAMRVWRPTGNPANQGKVGQWLRDGVTGQWNHIATMNVPFAATKFDGTMSGFLEDFSHGNANPRRAEFKNIYYRKGSWKPATTFRPSTRQATEKGTSGTMEDGTVGFFETCSGTTYTGNMGPGAVEMTYTLSTPANPTFDPLVVDNVTAEGSSGQVHVKWNLPATSAPQFSYKVEVFPSPDTSGTPAFTLAKIDPDVRECVVTTPGQGSTVRLTITDIFDRQSTPAVVSAAAAVLADAVTPGGTVPGLGYKYYETSLSALPDFASLAGSTLKMQGAVNMPDLTVRKKHTSYACQFSGYVNVPADGLWMFSLASCDGSKLLIDGSPVITNDGVHSGGSEAGGTLGLKAGLHAVELQYFKNSSTSGDNDQLSLSWEGPGLAKTLMKEACWARLPSGGEPSVTLTSPSPGAIIPASAAPLAANVSANGQTLNSVRFFNKDTVWATRTGTSSPFNTPALLGGGANHLKARLVYGAGSAFSIDSPPIDVTAVQPVLSPWNFSAIGQHAFQSAAGYDAGTWSLVGDGMNMAWQEISGDETIIAHVAGKPVTGSANGSQFDAVGFDTSWNGGIMFRENLSPSPGSELGSRFVALYKENGNSTRLQSSDDQNAGGPVVGANLGSNYTWFKLQRAGTLFTASLSTDGLTWTEVGTRTMATPFAAKMYVGLFTLARPSTNPNPHWWKFDNVSLASIGSGFQITTQPQSRTVYEGSTVNFSATVASAKPLSFQWQRGETDIPGATSATLTLPQVDAADAGSYRVIISDGTTTLTSDPATLATKPAGTGFRRAVEVQGPLAYWRLNETAGPTAVDSVGSNNGTFVGSLTVNQAGPRPAAFPSLEANNTAYKFNGNGSRVTIPALNLNSNTVTITAWVKRSGNAASFSGIVFSRAGNTVAGLTFGNSNELRYTWNDTGGSYNWNSGLIPPDGQWTFVALVVEPGQAKIYMDPGTGLVSATNGISHAIEEFNGLTCIGQDTSGSSRTFNGWIDEVALFNRSLSAAEIAAIDNPDASVSMSATTLLAKESGLLPGQFTVSRALASTAAPLTVSLASAGSATRGSDYALIGDSVTIPAGASSATIAVTPLADTIAEGPETVQLGLVKGGSYYIASPPATVTIEDLPMDAWRFGKFAAEANNPLISADDVDSEGDGMNNLLEYGMNTDPALSDYQLGPQLSYADGILALTYRRNLAATDITYTVVQSEGLGEWVPATVSEQIISDDGVTRVIKASLAPSADPLKFLRLRITRP